MGTQITETQVMDILPRQVPCDDVFMEKYTTDKEKALQPADAESSMKWRVAFGLSAAESVETRQVWAQRFYEAQTRGVRMAGRINSVIGSDISATPVNCFVQEMADSATESVGNVPGIYQALLQTTETLRRGGGVGLDFSPIRPRGAHVNSTQSIASGPTTFAKVFSVSCKTVSSAGQRRGAMMAVLRMDHPDIQEMITSKCEPGVLDQFNISISTPDSFMESMHQAADIELIHEAKPGSTILAKGAYQREDGMWVYAKVPAVELWDLIMKNTYEHGDPGLLFIDKINAENNLWYCEKIRATNPCAEQPLPPSGACVLASIFLVKYLRKLRFDRKGDALHFFDWELFKQDIHLSIRMLDNVVSVARFPLEHQKKEALSKRRVGLGVTGLATCLQLIGLPYSSEEGRTFSGKIAEFLRDESYRASVLLAKERGAFPLFDKRYLESPFIRRLPHDIQEDIERHGIRNSHNVSIAPTGTITIALCNNASSGIEPSFAWKMKRKRLMADGSRESMELLDLGYQLYLANGGDPEMLPDYFESALEISPMDHLKMVAVWAPFVDSAISKTINIPEDYSYEAFKDVYLQAYKMGLKGITTYRPNSITGTVLEVAGTSKGTVEEIDPDRRVRLQEVPVNALQSLRWPNRPDNTEGNPGWNYMVRHPETPFAIFVGHLENGKPVPFETWVVGEEQPRCLGAIAKSLSMDMRSMDRKWLQTKLQSLIKTDGDAFEMVLPNGGKPTRMRSQVSAFATLVNARCEQLGAFSEFGATPLMDSLMTLKEPKSDTNGTMSWTVDVKNVATGDDFALFVKEMELPDGVKRPYSVWVSGNFPSALNGLCKLISYDMRIYDVAWIGRKLRSLQSFPEPRGDFMAKIPGIEKSRNYPSTVAYMSTLLIHRYQMLGLLNEDGSAKDGSGGCVDAIDSHHVPTFVKKDDCPDCGAPLMKIAGCTSCTECKYTAGCG